MSLAYRMVVVDDIDSRIRYNGSWFPDKGSQDSLGYFGAPFRSTLHGTQANSSLEFQYNGAGFIAYGIMRVQNVSGVLDPTIECLFDGRLIGANYFTESYLNNNVELCGQDVAPDGLHTLTIKASTVMTFWFDAIRYVPLAGAPLDQETIIVAHGDPQVHYGEGWQDGATSRNGSIFTFEFIGISISAYGFTGPLNPSPAIYSIDGQDPIDFVVPGTPVGSTNQKIFEIAQLPAGPHSLRVTYQGNSNSAALWLDYFIVQNGTLSSTAASASSHATSSNGVASTSTPGTSSGNDVSDTSTPEKNSTPVGAIVGGVIGGLVLIIFVILALLLLLRRRKRRAAEEEIVSTTPQPFDFGHATLHPSNSTPNDFLPVQQSTLAIRKPLLAPLLVSRPSTSRPGRKAEVLAVPESQRQGDTLVLAMVSMQSNDTRSPDVVVHEDSGIRMPPSTPATNEITEVPPLYTVD